MKKILLAAFILICTSMAAQPPMGGRGGRPPGGERGERPHMQRPDGQEQEFMIMGLPEIPGLSLEQQEKLSKEITNERKDISKLMQKKNEIKIDSENLGISEKDRQKLAEKTAKVDEDIKKKEAKYDKKYRSILSEEQYKIFAEKKKEIQFTKQQPFGNRPERGEGLERPEREPGDDMMDPPVPDGDMF
ncbi:MAG: hypothetical protein ACK5KT_03250 [Dysgonomonas sp.]